MSTIVLYEHALPADEGLSAGGSDGDSYAAEDRQHNMVLGKQGLVWYVC